MIARTKRPKSKRLRINGAEVVQRWNRYGEYWEWFLVIDGREILVTSLESRLAENLASVRGKVGV